MDLHLEKLNKFCRLCKNFRSDSKNRSKHCVVEVLKLQHPDLEGLDFSNEDPSEFPSWICLLCYAKCNRWKIAFDKHKEKNRRKPVDKREAFEPSTETVSRDEIETGLVCTHSPECKACSLIVPELEIGPSPSKILKI